MLFCEICKADLPGYDAMQYHMTGKRHKQMVEFWEKRKQQADLSIYVRGYPNKTTEDELFNYFAQFGRVSKVSFAKAGNIYAIVEFATKDTVEYVLGNPNHILNSQHLICRPRELDMPNQPPKKNQEQGYRQFQQEPQGSGPNFGMPPSGGGPRYGGPGRFDGPQGRFDGPQGRFDGPPGRFDGQQGRFDGPQSRFDGPQGRFDGPQGRFDGPPGGFGGPPGGFGGPGGPMDQGGMGPQQSPGYGGPPGPQGFRGPRPFNPQGRYGPGGQMEFNVDMPMMQMDQGTGLMEPVFHTGPVSKKKKKKMLQESVDVQVDQYYHEETMEKMTAIKGVQPQLEWLCQHLQVTAEEAQMKFKLCETLQTTMTQFFPGCTVNQFGSSVNGFGITGCDMDIFLDFSTCTATWTNQAIRLPYVRDIRSISKKEEGPLSPQETKRLNMLDQCKLVSRIITEHIPGCSEISTVPSPRCPLVRFKHDVSGVRCDLSMNNSLALQNTKLLYLYSVLNSRVRLLVYAVRYWAKVKAIAGNPQSGTKLSNYALTLMVLCYLQNVDPPVLPTIEQLSNLHGPNDRTRIEGWDCTFAMDWQVIPSSNNTQTPAELLAGFFSFYSAYDFPNTVLMTHSGQSIPFTEFLNKENMPDGRIRHFKAGPINVQDPFVLDQNVCLNVNQKTLDVIMREIRIAAIKTSRWSAGEIFFRSPEAQKGADLMHLLSVLLPDIIQQEDKEREEAERNKGRVQPRKEGDPYQFSVELKPTLLTSKYLKHLQKSENYRIEWCRRTCAFITKVLREVIILRCEELPVVRRNAAGEEIPDVPLLPDSKEVVLVEMNLEQGAAKKQKLDNTEEEEEEMKEAETKETESKDEEMEAEAKEENNGEDCKEDSSQGKEAGDNNETKDGEEEKNEEGNEGKKKRRKRKKEQVVEVEYVPEAPPLRLRKPSTADVNFQFYIKSFCRTWQARKKVKQYLTNEGYEPSGMGMEKLISETIYQNENAPYPEPILGFYFEMESTITEKDTGIVITTEPMEGQKEFNCFFQFLKMFTIKMIEKYQCTY